VSGPAAIATKVEEVAPGVWHWRVSDERIGGFLSAAHAVRTQEGTVLIDPLGVVRGALDPLGEIPAIVVSAGTHQRWTWRYRRELGAQVWAPSLSETLEEEPDGRYGDGDRLPGGLLAIFTPGAGTTQHSLLFDGERRVLFTPDLFAHVPGEPLAFVPAEYMHDPDEARRSAERLLELDLSVLCTGHGVPVLDDPQGAIARALAD
jgi:glyoxylase-like metal-dependent hydrolase (beta-lactamase superfamily II)